MHHAACCHDEGLLLYFGRVETGDGVGVTPLDVHVLCIHAELNGIDEDVGTAGLLKHTGNDLLAPVEGVAELVP